MPDHGLAEEIADEMLYLTGRALKVDDFGAFADCMHLPHVLETIDGKRIVTSRKQFQTTFDRVRSYYMESGVTDVVRTVIRSEFLDRETVGSTHVAQLLGAGGERFRNPFPVYSVIKYIDRQWKIVSQTTVILDAPEHNLALVTEIEGRETAKFAPEL